LGVLGCNNVNIYVAHTVSFLHDYAPRPSVVPRSQLKDRPTWK